MPLSPSPLIVISTVIRSWLLSLYTAVVSMLLSLSAVMPLLHPLLAYLIPYCYCCTSLRPP
jgi:hypothetical protein